MSNSQTKKLGEICDIIGGGTPSKLNASFFVGNIPWATVRDMKSETIKYTEFKISKQAVKDSSTHIIQKNNVVIATRVGLGKICLLEKDTAINQDLHAVIPKNNHQLSVNYLFWWFKNISDVIVKNGSGATVQGVKLPFIKSLEIPLPPPSEQGRIIKILDEMFEGIAKVKENTEKNLQNIKELFESYLQSIFSNPGEGWEVKKLADVLKKTETINPLQNPNDKFYYIDVSSVNKENLSIENAPIIFGKDAPSRARKLIRTGDIIFATIRPTLKRIALIPEEYDKQICSTGYFVLRANEQINNKLIFYFLQTKTFNQQMQKLQKGASYPAVTDGDVRNQIIGFPKSLPKQKKIVAKLDALSEQTKKLEGIYKQKLLDLEELKKSVLKKAFAGEL